MAKTTLWPCAPARLIDASNSAACSSASGPRARPSPASSLAKPAVAKPAAAAVATTATIAAKAQYKTKSTKSAAAFAIAASVTGWILVTGSSKKSQAQVKKRCLDAVEADAVAKATAESNAEAAKVKYREVLRAAELEKATRQQLHLAAERKFAAARAKKREKMVRTRHVLNDMESIVNS